MRTRSALVYTVLRLLAFLIPFGVMMLFPVFQQVPWLAAVFAALIGLSLSLLFLRRPLHDATAQLTPRKRTGTDEDIEDAAADAAAAAPDAGQPQKAQNNSAP